MKKIIQAAGAVLRVMTWTPSRWAKYKDCPAKVKYEDLMKMCPKCFKGRVSGGYDGEPVVCDTCDLPQPERAALDRGNLLDAALTHHVAGPIASAKMEESAQIKLQAAVGAGRVTSEHFAESTRHPEVAKLATKLRKAKTGVSVQESIVMGPGWVRVSQFTKDAWARMKLDVLNRAKKVGDIIDWKSGNIDKTKGVIRERPEYYDSMKVYQISVLSVYPDLKEARATMVFLDAPPKLADPTKTLPVLKRKDLKDAQHEWEQKIAPMMNDRIFAPKPGMQCNWCPFAKKMGGPCPHGAE